MCHSAISIIHAIVGGVLLCLVLLPVQHQISSSDMAIHFSLEETLLQR